MQTKCTCERPDDNTCGYCEQQSSIQILKEAAENFYREFPSNPLDKPEWNYNRDVDCFKKRKAFINGAKWQQEQKVNILDKVNRVEIIQHSPPHNGRAYTNYNAKDVEIQFQDDGKTLKIFLI